jgi:hypothetical protein
MPVFIGFSRAGATTGLKKCSDKLVTVVVGNFP